MRPCILLMLALSALSCSVGARQVAYVGTRTPNQVQSSPFFSVAAASRPNAAKCYGLARKTRTRNIQVPVLYNSVSGQTAAVPDYLFSLDDRTIDKMESEGWEVRMKTVSMPDTFYQRMPVCCPWDTSCYHNQRQAQQMPYTQKTSGTGPCMNGGVLVPRGRTQACVCPMGYQGVWCQIPIQSTVATSSFPTGPFIPYKKAAPSSADFMAQAVRQAQMWKEKMLSARQPTMYVNGRPMTKAPLLSPNDHVITSINKHLAQQNPSEKALRMKMAMIMNLYLKQQGQRMRNQPKVPLPPTMLAHLFSKAKDPRYNPYSASTTPVQPFINPQIISMVNQLQVQGRNGVPTPLSPYGQALMPVQTYGRGPITLTGNKQGMNIPQPRTPWDMDPWERQRNSGRGQTMVGGPSSTNGRGQTMMSLGRDQLMALAVARYLNTIKSRLAGGAGIPVNGGIVPPNNMVPTINRRVPIREPPMTDIDSDYAPNPAVMDSVNNNNNNQDSAIPPYQSDRPIGTTEMPNQITDEDITSVEMPRPAQGRGDSDHQFMGQGNGPMTGQGMDQMGGAGPITSQQRPLGGMNGQQIPQGMNPQMVQGMPMGAAAGGAMPEMPSQEELQRMTECRVILEPRISMCMADAGHSMTLEQFMNPQYMENARGVCQDSESIGQCVMRQDQACGEGSALVMTRKMIDSVLQMMGMVCGQIAKMDQERGPRPQQHVPTPGMPPQAVNSPSLTTVPQTINIHPHTDNKPVGQAPVHTTVPTGHVDSEASNPSELPPKSSDKFTTSRIGAAVTGKTPSKAANKGHHSVEPVTSGSFIPGAPLWVVILVACIVLLISCFSLILIVLIVRRRRMEKTKEIERKACPLDPKLYTIGIPPPHYATTSIKTQDELTLPPLDLAENEKDSEEGSTDGGEEEEEEEEVKKPAVSDDDADDESDEKDEDGADKKKKEKKDKK